MSEFRLSVEKGTARSHPVEVAAGYGNVPKLVMLEKGNVPKLVMPEKK